MRTFLGLLLIVVVALSACTGAPQPAGEAPADSETAMPLVIPSGDINAPFVANSNILTAEEIQTLQDVLTSDEVANNPNIFATEEVIDGGFTPLFRKTDAKRFLVVEDAFFQPILISWLLFMIETNIRSATLVGILTGTGIGFQFDLYFKISNYSSASLVVLSVVIAVLVIETISNAIRRAVLFEMIQTHRNAHAFLRLLFLNRER